MTYTDAVKSGFRLVNRNWQLVAVQAGMMIANCIGIFVFGGSIGTVGRAVLDSSRKFSMKLFFAEAKRLFFPMMWFSMVMGLVFIAIAFFLGLLGGGVAAVVQTAKSQD